MSEPMRIYVEGKKNAEIIADALEQKRQQHVYYRRTCHECTPCLCDFCKAYSAGIEVCEVTTLLGKWTPQGFLSANAVDVHHLVLSTTKIGGEGEGDED